MRYATGLVMAVLSVFFPTAAHEEPRKINYSAYHYKGPLQLMLDNLVVEVHAHFYRSRSDKANVLEVILDDEIKLTYRDFDDDLTVDVWDRTMPRHAEIGIASQVSPETRRVKQDEFDMYLAAILAAKRQGKLT